MASVGSGGGNSGVACDLSSFALSDLIVCGADLRGIGHGARSMQEVAERVVRYLYGTLRSKQTGERNCVLVRLYKTHPFGSLPEGAAAFARAATTEQVAERTRCLTLLATAGDEPEWNEVTRSSAHRAIPLPSAEVVERLPMIANLVSQFGLEAHQILEPSPEIILEAPQRAFNVFYVPDAKGSEFVPAQDEFVVPYQVRSVLGFGGMLPGGDLYAVILFSRVPIARETAEAFRTMALHTKIALLPFVDGVVFDEESRA